MTGCIFNIQRYALHDGPGIRTTVFLKGCPLRCKWCHNPESFLKASENILDLSSCIACNACKNYICPEKCPTGALETVGKEYTVATLMEEILKDKIFYEQSGGGVTFSGGEPLLQGDFLLEVVKACKAQGIHVTLDTAGYADWYAIENLLPYVDLVLYDIKHLDDGSHQLYTGVSNQRILENLNRLLQTKEVYLRLPLIKGVNDDKNHLKSVLELARHQHILQVNILPYHGYAENKYAKLNSIKFNAFEPPDQAILNWLVEEGLKNEIKIVIGG